MKLFGRFEEPAPQPKATAPAPAPARAARPKSGCIVLDPDNITEESARAAYRVLGRWAGRKGGGRPRKVKPAQTEAAATLATAAP